MGRRAFGSKVFDKSEQGLQYRVNVFQDDRIGTGLSFDRLGVRRVEKDVLSFLCPLCDEMAKKKATGFVGWVQIHVQDIKNMIKSTDAVNEVNPYHAEVDRSEYKTLPALRALAFQLCVYASKHPFISKPTST